jgi:mono/diheme cytochrome c family protein
MQITIVPGESTHGAELFTEKGCIKCHSFNGRGGSEAPDLAQRLSHASTPSELAGALWNHSPIMWATHKSAGRPVPLMNSMETADLFAHFYSLLYFSQAGNTEAGKMLFEQKCASCHGSTGVKWSRVKDRMVWFERMWNHSGQVSRSLAKAGVAWPVFTAQEMTNLIAYIDTLPASRPEAAAFSPGNPRNGLNVFERECETCHAFGSAPGRKIDLLAVPAPRTLMDYAAAMWNHAQIMNRVAGARFPRLAEGEIKDLTAYLFAQRYFAERGDPRRGAQVYADKGCASCHEARPPGKTAPELAQATERFSPITLTSVLWRSGPVMLEAMKQKKMEWPEFHGSEMIDLIAFLNERLITRIGHTSPLGRGRREAPGEGRISGGS